MCELLMGYLVAHPNFNSTLLEALYEQVDPVRSTLLRQLADKLQQPKSVVIPIDEETSLL